VKYSYSKTDCQIPFCEKAYTVEANEYTAMLLISETGYRHTGCALRWLRVIYMAVLFTAQSVSGASLDSEMNRIEIWQTDISRMSAISRL
jgi:hypothetical protein